MKLTLVSWVRFRTWHVEQDSRNPKLKDYFKQINNNSLWINIFIIKLIYHELIIYSELTRSHHNIVSSSVNLRVSDFCWESVWGWQRCGGWRNRAIWVRVCSSSGKTTSPPKGSARTGCLFCRRSRMTEMD